MRAMPTLFVAISMLLLTMGGRAEAQAQPTEAYPIWWSSELELYQLAWIDAVLNKDFPEIMWKVFAAGDPDNTTKIIVDNCDSYLEATKNKYYKIDFRDRQEHDEYARLRIRCETLGMLKRTRPAETSHLRDFVFAAGVLDFLPEMVRQNYHHERACEVRRANETGIPWSQFVDFPIVDVASQTEVVVLGKDLGVRLEIMARGDFDGDTLDDILVRSSILPYPDGNAGDIRLFVLTRFSANGVLRVLNPPHLWSPCDPD